MPDFDPRLNNPYVGPRPFEKSDRLFGREREKNDLYNLLIGRRTVLLHSPSGAGKTSLINAGLSLILDARKMPTLPVARVNSLPPPSFVERAPTFNRYRVSAIMSLEGIQEDGQEAADLASLAQLSLAQYLEQRMQDFPLPKGSLGWVVVFDQFEEILTQDLTDEQAKRAFFLELSEALGNPSLYWLFAMREDYTATLEPYFRLLPGGMEYRYRLDFLRKDQARQAIVGPAKSADPPVEFQADAAEKLLDDLRKVKVQLPDGNQKEDLGPYIEPVQLSVVCRRLWECRSLPDQITAGDLGKLSDFAASQGDGLSIVDQALQDFYVEEILKVAGKDLESGRPENPVLARRIRWWFSQSLILGDLRGQVLKQAGNSAGLDNELIEKLVRTHLVRAEQRRGLTWYELAHDRLVAPIKRSNEAYFGAADYTLDYRRQALVWEAQGRDPAILLTREQLEKAQVDQALQGEAVSPLEREFVLESQKALRLAEAEDLLRQKRLAERGLNLEDTGWGFILPAELPPDQCESLKLALHELLQQRGRQAMRKRRDYFKEFSKSLGYQRGESAHDFLVRHGATSGVTSPDKMPYYLLIVGGPAQIPYEFQFDLDERFAVGRLAFDTLDEYASYARSVVEAESGAWSLEKKAQMFCRSLDSDVAETHRKYLIEPLSKRLASNAAGGWQIEVQEGAQANKAALRQALGGEGAPVLLFTTTAGISPYSSRQAQEIYRSTGALVVDGDLPQGAFTAEDVSEEARLTGLVAFLLGAYSAGAQAVDDYWWYDDKKPRRQAERPFVASLPKRLLGHPQGGALGVIGHVDNLWTSFYMSESRSPDIDAIAGFLERLMDGHTLGSALEPLNLRYRRYADLLSEQLVEASFRGGKRRPEDLRDLMVRTIDARNLILLGDPAARLPLEGGQVVEAGPVIEPVAVVAAAAGVSQAPEEAGAPTTYSTGGEQPAGEAAPGEQAAPEEQAAPAAPGEQAEAARLAVSGIWAESGRYLLELAPQALAEAARGETFDDPFTRGLQYWYESRTRSTY